MRCINLDSRDPFFNLAAEEYLLKSCRGDYFITGINNPSVIIGKHQIAHAETNVTFVTKRQIPVIRRISGGGTVYHDQGNLNFAFIRDTASGHQVDFKRYIEPITGFLNQHNVESVFDGVNQINTGGLKISGNAEHIFKNRVLHHGTLLFKASLENMHGVLAKNTEKYSSRAVQSNRTSVTNLSGKLKGIDTIEDLKSGLTESILEREPLSEKYIFTENEIIAINALAASKYNSWEWNFAYGPAYKFNNTFLINGLNHKCFLDVQDGIIKDCMIEGEMFFNDLGRKLIGKRHMFAELSAFLTSEDHSMNEDIVQNFF